MKPVSYSDAEISWEYPLDLAIDTRFNMEGLPSKAVLALITEIEKGKLPIIKAEAYQNLVILKESFPVYEAYIRCHISRVPVQVIEREVNEDDPDPTQQEESDREEPF